MNSLLHNKEFPPSLATQLVSILGLGMCQQCEDEEAAAPFLGELTSL
jgi:hypothetical protein